MLSDKLKVRRVLKPRSADAYRRTSSMTFDVQRYYSFIADEATLAKSLDIPPGLYSFIQSKSEKRMYLHLIVNYEGSAHRVLARSYVKLPEEDLYTAGEIIIDASGRVGPWAFRTGGYAASLHLQDDEIMKGMIQKKITKYDLCGLPRDKFYFARIWIAYYEAGFTRCFFDEKGRFRLKSDYSQIIPDITQGVAGRFRGMHTAIENIAFDLDAAIRPKPLEEKLNTDVELEQACITIPASTRNNSLAHSDTQYSFFHRRSSASLSSLAPVNEVIPITDKPEPTRESCFSVCFSN